MNIRFLIGAFFCLVSSFCYGFDDTPDCFNQLERNFFITPYTQQSFSKYNVPQSSWTLIYNQLVRASASVPARVKAKANRLAVNPLENPFDPAKAWEILEQVLFDDFLQVLQANNTFHQFNDNSIKGMFDFIKDHRAKEIDACFQNKNGKKVISR